MSQYQDPAIAIDKTLQDVRDVFYAWLQADPERDPDLDFNYAGAPIPMNLSISALKQERFIEDTKLWEDQLYDEEIKMSRELGMSEEDINKIPKWESPLRKQVEISLEKVTRKLMRKWRKGPDFIFDLFRAGTNKDQYQTTVTQRKPKKEKSFEEEISEEDRLDEGDYDGPTDSTLDSDTNLDDF